MRISRVTFKTLDRKHPHLEQTAMNIAIFLMNHRSLIHDYHQFMKVSTSWQKETFRRELDVWFAHKYKRVRAQDHHDFKKLLYEYGEVCSNQVEIEKMRGLVPERLSELVFQDLCAPDIISAGAEVAIDGRPVRYSINSDEKKRTVDVGWKSAASTHFAEVKCSPRTFRQKDICYLRLLHEKMKEAELAYQTYLVSLDEKDYLRLSLEELQLWDSGDQFILWGKAELMSQRSQIA